jgi:hypothetical protein
VYFGLYMLQKNWRRQGGPAEALRQGAVPLVWLSAFLICLVFSWKSALGFLLAGVGAGLAVILLERWEILRKRQRVFSPVGIRPAFLMGILSKKTLALSAAPGAVLLSVFFALDSFFLPLEGQKGLSFPAPSGYTILDGFTSQALGALDARRSADALPDLGNFVHWVWEALAMPYRSLHAGDVFQGSIGEVLAMPLYRREGPGIVPAEEIRRVFDDEFIAQVLGNLDDDATVEGLLKSQGGFVTVNYEAAALSRGDKGKALILMIAAAAISPAATAAFLYDRRKRRRPGGP